MFTTYESFRAPLSRIWGDTDDKFWSTVKLTWNRIWFIVTYTKSVQMGDDLLEVKETLFLGETAQFDVLVSSVERIEEIYIVTPAHVNGGNGWEIERLRNVRNALEPSPPPQQVQLFETASGRRYTNSLLGTPWEDLLLKGAEMNFECNTI